MAGLQLGREEGLKLIALGNLACPLVKGSFNHILGPRTLFPSHVPMVFSVFLSMLLYLSYLLNFPFA